MKFGSIIIWHNHFFFIKNLGAVTKYAAKVYSIWWAADTTELYDFNELLKENINSYLDWIM